jgi:hypothetical protein
MNMMENKLYLILNANTKDENDSLILGMNVLLSYLRSNPHALECMRLIVLNSKGIVIDKPIYEDFNLEITQTASDGDLKKSFRIIIDHLNSVSRDKIYPVVLCFNLVISNQDFSEELYELNKITQGVNLITSVEFYDYYKPFYVAADKGKSLHGFAGLNLIESVNVEFFNDLFKHTYIGIEVSIAQENREFPEELPTPEYTDMFFSEITSLESKDSSVSEDQQRKFVGKIFQDLNLTSYIIICSKACLEGPKDIEWLIIPKKGMLPGQELVIIEDLKKEYNLYRCMGTQYFYKLKFNSKPEFIFTYGKIEDGLLDDIVESFIQPAIILSRTELLESFIKYIFTNIDKYPPNKLRLN